MALIAVIGVMLTVGVEVPRLRKLGLLYRSRAQSHADLGRAARGRAATEAANLAFWAGLAAERRRKADANEPRPDSDESWEEAANRSREQADWFAREVATFTKRAAYHEAMSRKWLHASAYPWMGVEPDTQMP
jgi:hypothetical protein